MNRDQFEGNWKKIKGKVKEKWGKFTDDDVQSMNGKYDQFVGHLQEKYGYEKERAEKEISSWKGMDEFKEGSKSDFDEETRSNLRDREGLGRKDTRSGPAGERRTNEPRREQDRSEDLGRRDESDEDKRDRGNRRKSA